jgi:hypothetical protein
LGSAKTRFFECGSHKYPGYLSSQKGRFINKKRVLKRKTEPTEIQLVEVI